MCYFIVLTFNLQTIWSFYGQRHAFLVLNDFLILGLLQYLSLQDGEMWFSEEIFQDHKSASMKQFLQSAIHLQSFKQVHAVLGAI